MAESPHHHKIKTSNGVFHHPNKKEHHHGNIFTLVHFVCFLLAPCIASPISLPNYLADMSPSPLGGHRCRRCF